MDLSNLLPSMPLLFSNSQRQEIQTEPVSLQPEHINGDGNCFVPLQESQIKTENGSPSSEKNIIPDIQTFETTSKRDKECELEPISSADSLPTGEKRKLMQSHPRKKKRLDSNNDCSDDKGPQDSTHYADAFFSKAKSLLDENTFKQFIAILSETIEEPGAAVALYKKLSEILAGYPQLLGDFIGFLKPEQAQECGKVTELQFIEKCWSFLKKLDSHHGNKFQHALEQQSPDFVSPDAVKSSILPIFKGSPHLSEAFLHLLPDEKPPPSSKDDYEDISETTIEESAWERIRIPEHPDRGCQPNCDCRCHNLETKQFCLSCNLKFSNGQIYIKDGKVLRFARLSFGDVPFDTMLQRLHPSLYSKRREKRKASKSVNCSVSKEEVPCEDENVVQSKEDLQPASSPDRCDKTEEEDDYWDDDDVSVSSDKSSVELFDSLEDPDTSDSTRFLSLLQPISPICSLIDEESQKEKIEITQVNLIKMEPADEIKQEKEDKTSNDIQIETKTEKFPDENSIKQEKVWTREEDKMILQTFQKEIGTEQTFSKISNLMPSRSVNDIQGRFQVLMNLLEKVASGSHEIYPI